MIRLGRMAREVWRARWNALRWGVAAFLVWAVAMDFGARAERGVLEAMPDFDVAREVAALREQGRYGEAVVLADGALAGAAEHREAIARERARAVGEQGSFVRRVKDVGLGALMVARGSSRGGCRLRCLSGRSGRTCWWWGMCATWRYKDGDGWRGRRWTR